MLLCFLPIWIVPELKDISRWGLHMNVKKTPTISTGLLQKKFYFWYVWSRHFYNTSTWQYWIIYFLWHGYRLNWSLTQRNLIHPKTKECIFSNKSLILLIIRMENCQFNFSRCIIKQIELQETSTDVLNFNLGRYDSITVISLNKNL